MCWIFVFPSFLYTSFFHFCICLSFHLSNLFVFSSVSSIFQFLSSLNSLILSLTFLPFHMSLSLVYPKFLFFVAPFICLSSISAFHPLIPSPWPHPHVNNKSHPAPPHLWGNPLAGHLRLSDKEQYRCFIRALLFLPLWLFLYDFQTQKSGLTLLELTGTVCYPARNRCSI